MADWTGNKNSIYKTLGASNHTDKEREENDYYATAPMAIDKLLSSGIRLPNKIWECACGEGHLSERLKYHGYDVVSTDAVWRGYGEGVVDFLDVVSIDHDIQCILTNPPYKYATEFVLKALEQLPVGGYAIFLLKTTALEGKKRYERIYKNHPPRYILQFIERLLCAKNADFEGMKAGGGSAVSYAWFVWEKGYVGDTVVKWI